MDRCIRTAHNALPPLRTPVRRVNWNWRSGNTNAILACWKWSSNTGESAICVQLREIFPSFFNMAYDPHIDVVQILAAMHSLLENAKFPANDSEALVHLKKAIRDAITEIQLATPAVAMTEKHQA